MGRAVGPFCQQMTGSDSIGTQSGTDSVSESGERGTEAGRGGTPGGLPAPDSIVELGHRDVDNGKENMMIARYPA